MNQISPKLLNLLKSNDDEKKQKILNFLTELDLSELNNSMIYLKEYYPKNQSSTLDKEVFDQMKKMKGRLGLLELFKKEEFWKLKFLPIQIKKIVSILDKLNDRKFFIILELCDYSFSRITITQFSLLKKLLEIKYSNLQEHQSLLEEIIGTILVKQVFELEYFIKQWQDIDKEQFQEVSKKIQMKNINPLQQIVRAYHPFAELFTQIWEEINLDRYLRAELKMSSDQLNFEEINAKLELYIRQNGNIEHLYFRVVAYFWGKYCDYIISYKNEIQKKPNDQDLRIRVLKDLQVGKQIYSSIPEYFLNRFIYFSSESPLFSWQMEQFNMIIEPFKKSQESLQKFFSKEMISMIIWKQIQQLPQSVLNKIQIPCPINKFLIQIIWRNNSDQLNDQIIAKAFQFTEYDDILSYHEHLRNLLNNHEYLIRDLLTLKFIYINSQNQGFPIKDFYQSYQIIPELLCRMQLSNELPQQTEINLESFNISLAQLSNQEKDQILDDWAKQMNNQEAFRKLIPFYFNIIKRGESMKQFPLDIEDSLVRNNRTDLLCKSFNMKALFQILYNNSNQELKVVLLKLHSQFSPVPLLYQNLQTEKIYSELDLYKFNHNIFYIFPKCFPIICFTLSKKTRRFGKTSFINKVFFKNFETQDNCEINKNTVDIMFDFNFERTRELAIADVHGLLPFPILIKILPLFCLWIVQLDTESELEENYEALQQILMKLEIQQPKICLVIRNLQDKPTLQKQDLIKQIEARKIDVLCVQDISVCGKNIETRVIQNAQKFFYSRIYHYNNEKDMYEKKKEKGILRNQSYFQEVMNEFQNDKHQIQEFNETIVLFKKNLQDTREKQDGFYNKDVFAIRSIEDEIKETKKQMKRLGPEERFSQKKFMELSTKVEELERTIKLQKPSALLQLFCAIFSFENFYVLYLMLLDALYEFNEKKNKKLFEKSKEISRQIKEQENSKDLAQQNIDFLNNLRQQLQKKQFSMKVKSVKIEIFWRELIKYWQINPNFMANFDLVEVVYKLIRKGQPFEFLNGDDLEISKQFIHELVQKFKQKNEKVLIVSALGAQSSGKSTILNKIFGCHFLTSVGSTTKGITLQLLNVQIQEQYNQVFDYILLLDTEGLQNPNKQDLEFDKKISLFILAISDIILLITKGDLQGDVKKLILNCILTLSSIKEAYPTIKQLSWCFNQNNESQNKNAFKQQLEQVVAEDEKQLQNYKVDYQNILNNENIQILGFATSNQQICKSWQKLKLDHTFSNKALTEFNQTLNKYLSRLQNQQSNLYEMKNFITRINDTWETIQRIPDLLEFNEVIQQVQDKTMKDKFDSLWLDAKVKIDQKIQEDIRKLEKKEENSCNNDINDVFTKIQNYVKEKFKDTQNILIGNLETIKNTNNIQQSIFLKYKYLLELQIEQEVLEYYFVNLKEKELKKINNLKKSYQKRIKNFLTNLGNAKLEKYQKNPLKIQKRFDKLWKNFNQESKNEFESLFSEFQDNLIKTLTLSEKDSNLSTERFTYYLSFFHDQLNRQEPHESEKEQIYKKLCQSELKQQPNFMVLPQDSRHSVLMKNFLRDFDERIRNKNIEFIKVQECFEITRNYVRIKKTDFATYLKYNLFEDLMHLINYKLIKREEINGFFSILQLFNVPYSDSALNQIIIELQAIYQSDLKRISPICQQFIENLKFQNIETILEDNYFVQVYDFYYRQLKCEILTTRNIADEFVCLKEIMSDNICIRKAKSYKPITQGNQNIQSFYYLIQPKKNKEFQKEFQECFPMIFDEKMFNSETGWQSLFSQVYDFVMNEIKSASQINIHNRNIQEFHQTKQMTQNIDLKIQTFNIQFSFYGLVLGTIGERLIKYFSIFIIWRRFCSHKWKKIQETLMIEEKLKEQLFSQFKAEIMQNTREQTINQVTTFIKQILITLKTKYYENNKQKVNSFLNSQKISSFKLIQQLDEEFLSDIIRPPHILNQTYFYITNQKEFINNYVQNRMNEIIYLIQSEHQFYLQKDLKQHIEILRLNVDKMLTQIGDEKPVHEYFEQGQDEEQCKQYFLDIVIYSLQGRTSKLNDLLQQNNRNLFQNYIQTNTLIEFEGSNNHLQNLKQFLKELQKQLQQIDLDENSEIEPEKFLIEKEIVEVRSFMLGCQETCPFCNRKCDENFLFQKEDHRHVCQNGHQIRGINKITVQGAPSLLTCEELVNQDYMQQIDSNMMFAWKDIKSSWNWNFNILDYTKQSLNQQKVQTVWNGELGKKICKDLGMFYENRHLAWKKYLQYEEKVHYIVAIEHSYATRGEKWFDCYQSTTNLIFKYQENYNSKISVIVYHQIAQIVIDCESIGSNGGIIIHTDQVNLVPEDQIQVISELQQIASMIVKDRETNILFKFYSLIEFDSNLDEILKKMRSLSIQVEKYKYDQSTFCNDQMSEKMDFFKK